MINIPYSKFICPDGETCEIEKCLERCRIEGDFSAGRCLSHRTLTAISEQRKWRGTPSATQLLGGMKERFEMGIVMEFKHVSVLLDETIENLDIKPDGIYVDGTLGGAGHAREVCKRLGENGRFIGIDQDEEAIAVSTKRLEEFRFLCDNVVPCVYAAVAIALYNKGWRY